jgi:hypothetical protein
LEQVAHEVLFVEVVGSVVVEGDPKSEHAQKTRGDVPYVQMLLGAKFTLA